jgi:hypothetical protein
MSLGKFQAAADLSLKKKKNPKGGACYGFICP